MQNAAITLRSLGSARDNDTGGRAISHPLSSLLVEGCPYGADLSSAFGAPLLQGATLLACKNAIRKRNQYSPKYENTASLTFPFTPLREPTSAPFGAPPSKGRRERCESTPFPPIVISSECEKSFSFAVRQNGRTTENGKHRVP